MFPPVYALAKLVPRERADLAYTLLLLKLDALDARSSAQGFHCTNAVCLGLAFSRAPTVCLQNSAGLAMGPVPSLLVAT